MAAAAWLTVAAEHVRAVWPRWRQQDVSPAEVLPWSGIVSFLAVMPFSYLPWEKYPVPLLVLVVLALCAAPGGRGAAD